MRWKIAMNRNENIVSCIYQAALSLCVQWVRPPRAWRTRHKCMTYS